MTNREIASRTEALALSLFTLRKSIRTEIRINLL